jgi:hypothetical protein
MNKVNCLAPGFFLSFPKCLLQIIDHVSARPACWKVTSMLLLDILKNGLILSTIPCSLSASTPNKVGPLSPFLGILHRNIVWPLRSWNRSIW